MRKLIILAVSLVALAAIAVPIANAAVTYDNAGVGHVDKDDIQNLFGWNDAALQSNAASGNVKFTSKKAGVFDFSWNCSDGSTQHSIYTITTTQPLNVTALKNKHGKVTDWTLDGVSTTVPATTTNETSGVPFWFCPAGSTPDLASFGSKSASTSIVQVNGVDLPLTPVAVPAV